MEVSEKRVIPRKLGDMLNLLYFQQRCAPCFVGFGRGSATAAARPRGQITGPVCSGNGTNKVQYIGHRVYWAHEGSKLYQMFGLGHEALHARWSWKPCAVPKVGLFSDLGSMMLMMLPCPPDCGNGSFFRFAAEELKRDREIVLTAVRRSGLCLESLAQLFDIVD